MGAYPSGQRGDSAAAPGRLLPVNDKFFYGPFPTGIARAVADKIIIFDYNAIYNVSMYK